jgi:hypothetical protein
VTATIRQLSNEKAMTLVFIVAVIATSVRTVTARMAELAVVIVHRIAHRTTIYLSTQRQPHNITHSGVESKKYSSLPGESLFTVALASEPFIS